jgi:aminoglycoside phosphotransferase family enzyme
MLDTTLREKAATDKKLTKLAKSVVNLRAKAARKQPKTNGTKSAVAKAFAKVVKEVKKKI